MVIAIHSLYYTNLEENISQIISLYVATIAVPIFFLTDGFLLAKTAREPSGQTYFFKLKSDALQLLVPWAFFSIIYFLGRLVYELEYNPSMPVLKDKELSAMFSALYVGASAGHMYFLLSLFLIRALSFAIRPLATAPVFTHIACLLGYKIIWTGLDLKGHWADGQDPIVHALWGLQYYLLGMLLCRDRLKMHAPRLAIGFLTLFAISILSQVELSAIIQYSYLLGVYFSALALTPDINLTAPLARYNMGVYLLHFPIAVKISSVLATKLGSNGDIWSYLGIVFCAYLLSLLATLILSRFRVGAFILGRSSLTRR